MSTARNKVFFLLSEAEEAHRAGESEGAVFLLRKALDYEAIPGLEELTNAYERAMEAGEAGAFDLPSELVRFTEKQSSASDMKETFDASELSDALSVDINLSGVFETAHDLEVEDSGLGEEVTGPVGAVPSDSSLGTSPTSPVALTRNEGHDDDPQDSTDVDFDLDFDLDLGSNEFEHRPTSVVKDSDRADLVSKSRPTSSDEDPLPFQSQPTSRHRYVAEEPPPPTHRRSGRSSSYNRKETPTKPRRDSAQGTVQFTGNTMDASMDDALDAAFGMHREFVREDATPTGFPVMSTDGAPSANSPVEVDGEVSESLAGLVDDALEGLDADPPPRRRANDSQGTQLGVVMDFDESLPDFDDEPEMGAPTGDTDHGTPVDVSEFELETTSFRRRNEQTTSEVAKVDQEQLEEKSRWSDAAEGTGAAVRHKKNPQRAARAEATTQPAVAAPLDDRATREIPQAAPRSIEERLDEARQMLDRGNLATSLEYVEAVLDEDPFHEDGHVLRSRILQQLEALQTARVGSLESAPRLAVEYDDLLLMPIDAQAMYLISQMDGMATIADLIDISGLGKKKIYALLTTLVDQGVIKMG